MRHEAMMVTLLVTGLAIGCKSPGPAADEPSAAKSDEARAEAESPHDGEHDDGHEHAPPKGSGGEALSIGASAPKIDREMESIDGSAVSVKSAADENGVLVIFTCNHCPWVKAWQERTVALANAFLEQGVGVVAINSNDPAANAIDGLEGMQERAETLGMKYPYVVDEGSVMARAYGATKTPEFFLFDSDLELVYHGAIDDNAQKPEQVTKTYLRDALSALAEGQPIAITQTKALGCGIKFRDPS